VAKSVISIPNDRRLSVPLSHGVRKGNVLQVSGQVSFDPATGDVVGGTVAEQTVQVLTNIQAILEAGGAGFEDVVMVRVYLTDTAHFAELNEAYSSFVPEPFPARTTVYVGLPEPFLVEIDALAVLD
jgi:2-iminobutanoate/2-iminopropanoate deaminase